MKKVILFLILAEFSCHLFSQTYHKFIDENRNWFIHYYCTLGGCGKYQKDVLYYFKGDTAINSVTYKVLKGKTVNGIIPMGNPYLNEAVYNAGYFREDTVQKKVYQYYFGNSLYNIQSREILIYDFSLSIGDTFSYPTLCSKTMTTTTLKKIDTIYSQTGDKLKRFILKDGFTYTEVLGGDIITDTTTVCTLFFGGSFVECMTINGESYFGDYCNEVSLKRIRQDNIQVYPTLASDMIYIKMSDVNHCNILVYSVSGYTVLNKSLFSGFESLNVNTLVPGIYYYQIREKNKILKTGKFIKTTN